jgi:hypothetical protein
MIFIYTRLFDIIQIMKIINAFDGAIVQPGDYFLDPFILFDSPEHTAWMEINDPRNLAKLGRCYPTKSTVECICLPGKPDAHHVKLVRIKDNFFSAMALFESKEGKKQWMPLTVRFTHPHFLFQRVGFINT